MEEEDEKQSVILEHSLLSFFTCKVVLTVTTSFSHGGNLLMVLVRKDTIVSP